MRKIIPIYTEQQLSDAIFDLIAWKYKDLAPYFIKIPNEAVYKNKRLQKGINKGAADILYFGPMPTGRGIFIELKVKKNKLTKSQKKFSILAKKNRYLYLICNSVEYFIYIMDNLIDTNYIDINVPEVA